LAGWQGGAELDWKSRPGKYVESGAYMVLRVQAAAPITRSADTARQTPYARVVFISEYKDAELYIKLRQMVSLLCHGFRDRGGGFRGRGGGFRDRGGGFRDRPLVKRAPRSIT
jgi:hypothetical protein